VIPIVDPLMPYNFRPKSHEISAIEQLREALEAHRYGEERFLEQYGEEIRRHDSPLVKFILELVQEDEESHHKVLGRIIARLDADLAWRQKEQDPLPRLGALTMDERLNLLDMTNRFIGEELQSIAQCRALMKMAKDCYGGLLTLMLSAMILDSQKHLLLLRFMRKQLKATKPTASAKRFRAF
jgi:hypothetical protein